MASLINMPQLRTVTLGLNAEPDNWNRTVDKAKLFFETLQPLEDAFGIQSRCHRLTCQSLDQLFDQQTDPEQIVNFAQTMEQALTNAIWLCLPGPFFTAPQDRADRLDIVPAVIANTRQVFMNTLVGSAQGLHRQAVQKSAEVIQTLANQDASGQANFRFAVMSNVKPHTPYFPASYHQGQEGFSIALELSELVNEEFAQPGDMNHKLMAFERSLRASIRPVQALAEELQKQTGYVFKGFDFSLAPFPGERTSAIAAIENLNSTPIGTYEFLFSLYAVNSVLKSLAADIPSVGYNGTMLSVLEDTGLARRTDQRAYSVKDLLLYSTVCGCGLDMIPLTQDTPVSEMASLIQAVSTEALKWDKPLIARLLPSAASVDEATAFKHEFIVNTRPLPLAKNEFAQMTDESSFFVPMNTGRQKVSRYADDGYNGGASDRKKEEAIA